MHKCILDWCLIGDYLKRSCPLQRNVLNSFLAITREPQIILYYQNFSFQKVGDGNFKSLNDSLIVEKVIKEEFIKSFNVRSFHCRERVGFCAFPGDFGECSSDVFFTAPLKYGCYKHGGLIFFFPFLTFQSFFFFFFFE